MSTPIHTIRPLIDGDLAEAVALTDTMDWNLGEEDFRFMNIIEPGGCFVAISGGRVVGLITTASFGHVGWLGNVIVESTRRGKGLGKALVEKALSHLEKKGVTTTGLYAYQNVIHFYEQFGFVGDRDFLWLVCQEAAWKGTPCEPLPPERLKDLLRLDEDFFGASRRRLLSKVFKASPSLCRGIFRNGRLLTYVMGSKGESAEVGPWASLPGYDKESLALFRSLADVLNGLKVFIGVPAWRSEIINFLFEIGFKEDFRVARMYRGLPLPERQGILAIESLERG